MAALVLLLLLLAVGAASLTGRTADSRHSDYTLGPITRRHPKRVRP